MINKTKNNKNWLWIIASQIIILSVCIVNVFPRGYTFAGGDVFQFINLSSILKNMNYLWSNNLGEGMFLQNFSYSAYYHVIQFVSNLFKLAPSNQSFVYYFIFLFGSFWAFFLSIRFFQKHDQADSVSVDVKVIFSLLYTFNVYVFYNFFYIWGISPFLFLYILLPPIFGLTYAYFSDRESNRASQIKLLAWLVVMFVLTNIPNGNLAFCISLNIFLFLFIFLYWIFHHKQHKFWVYAKRTIVYYVVYLFSVSWSVLPQIIEMIRQLNNFETGQSYFNIRDWILWQAARFPQPFLIFQNPNRVPLTLYWATLLSITLSIYAIIALIKSKFSSKIITIFLILLIADIFLLNKGVGILNPDIIWLIFKNPILSSLRSYDKAAIFLPFLFIIMIFLGFNQFGKKDHVDKKLIYLLLGLNLVSVFPFFLGKIQTKYSLSFSNGENYLNARYSYVNKIPSVYTDLANNLNQDNNDDKIIRVPYNVINSAGWTNYPKWQQVGIDPTPQFFNKPNIEMNSFGAFGLWNYGDYWNGQKPEDSVWLLNLAGLMNARYLMFQKDVIPKFITETSGKIDYYVNQGYITKIQSNTFFDLYRISDRFFLPHIYTSDNITATHQHLADFSEVLNKNQLSGPAIYFQEQNSKNSVVDDLATTLAVTHDKPTIEYKKVNPTEYQIVLHHASGVFPLILSETFHSGWRLYQTSTTSETAATMSNALSSYNFNKNDHSQATKDELAAFINAGSISTIGNDKSQMYMSNGLDGTIQNDNLPNPAFDATWFKSSVLQDSHMTVNGYANSWVVNTDTLCSSSAECHKNSDGSYDITLIAEFWPQRLFYLGLGLTCIILALAAIVLLYRPIRTIFKKQI